jgi:rhodanese-related sulfurtransferase
MNIRTETGANESAHGRRHSIERVVNILLIVVALIFTVSIARRFLHRDAGAANQALILKAGMKLELANMDWSKNGRTLVLGLSTTCHFCTESAPFYQKIVRQLARHQGATRIVAVLPQPVAAGQKYLQDLGVSVDEVREANMVSMGLGPTPTLAVVDDAGVVTAAWVGKLGISQQYEVLKQLKIDTPHALADGDSQVTSIDSATLKRAMEQKEHFTLIDVGRRESFNLGHIPGSLNIPFDELEARADDELAHGDVIIIYGHDYDDDVSENAVSVLVDSGFNKVSLLSGGYSQWKQSGFLEEKQR